MNLALPLLLIAAAAAEPTAEQRGQDVLAHAREALGAKRAAIHAVSLEAEMRRVQPTEGGEPSDMSGDVSVDLRLPDRYLKIETLSPFPGAPAFSVGTGLDGPEAWRARVGDAGGPHIVVRFAEPQGPDAAERLLRRTRGEMVRLLLLALAASPAEGGMKVAYAGEAEAPDGRADRVDVSDAQGLVGTLFVDQASHRPLFLSFQTQAPRVVTMRSHPHEPGERPHLPEAPSMQETPEVEARLYASDWKAVDGLLLPHHLSQSTEGGATEEWAIKKWTLDPHLKDEHFRRRK
jgi:hypothetical protein